MARRRPRNETHRVSLGEDLRIARAREVSDLLMRAAAAAVVEIDGASVAKVDGAGLQALAAGVAALRAKKVKVRWGGASPALSSAAAIAGFAAALELA